MRELFKRWFTCDHSTQQLMGMSEYKGRKTFTYLCPNCHRVHRVTI